jgi:excisionase family DNA binding protein
MDSAYKQQRLKAAFEDLRHALERAESALIEYEGTLDPEEDTSAAAAARPQGQPGVDLLSIPEVCQELGMGKSWVYQRIRSGEIPSIKLGHNIKVRRQVLEEYLQGHAYRPREDEPLEGEE